MIGRHTDPQRSATACRPSTERLSRSCWAMQEAGTFTPRPSRRQLLQSRNTTITISQLCTANVPKRLRGISRLLVQCLPAMSRSDSRCLLGSPRRLPNFVHGVAILALRIPVATAVHSLGAIWQWWAQYQTLCKSLSASRSGFHITLNVGKCDSQSHQSMLR